MNEDELNATVLDRFHETISALCCAGAYITSSDEAWNAFIAWLEVTLKSEPDFVLEPDARDKMEQSIKDGDHFLMITEGLKFIHSDVTIGDFE